MRIHVSDRVKPIEYAFKALPMAQLYQIVRAASTDNYCGLIGTRVNNKFVALSPYIDVLPEDLASTLSYIRCASSTVITIEQEL